MVDDRGRREEGTDRAREERPNRTDVRQYWHCTGGDVRGARLQAGAGNGGRVQHRTGEWWSTVGSNKSFFMAVFAPFPLYP